MKEYTYRFYKNDKHLFTKTFVEETEETANKKADKFVKDSKGKYEEWEPINNNKPKNGTQRSPFGIGS